ncbi:MAG: NAD(P)/FAD-dependent oxidoreductase [Jatrophihabitans sp.]
MSRRSVAVVGSGVAGLTAAYVAQKHADVTLFEADNRLGGHAHTHDLSADDGASVGVDTGFIVHNERTYPTLLRLFAELGVLTQDSDMSMSVRCGGCGLQYAGARGLRGLFPVARRACEPRYLRMLGEVLKFHRRARRVLASREDETAGAQTLGEFVRDGHYSAYFSAHFVTPLISAVWSCSPELAMQYPARYLFQFLANHGMLSVTGTPQWRTVVGGSGRYVELAAKGLTAVRTATPVRSVERTGTGVRIRDADDQVGLFDAVVIATHPNQALAMLAAPTATERELLDAIPYSLNPTVLHTDTSVLPRAVGAQASWNYYLPSCDVPAAEVHVSYDMNRLQRLETPTRYLVTLNDGGEIDPALVIDRMSYEHPVFTPTSVAAQRRLPELNDGTMAFAGAYHGWGFHEDGCKSGVDAAASLGLEW